MQKIEKQPLSEPQKQTLEMICHYIDQNGTSPTYQKIGEFFGISVPSVQGRLKSLLQKGYIDKTDGKRGLRVLRRYETASKFIALSLSGTVFDGKIVPITPSDQGKIFVSGKTEELANCYSLLVGDHSLTGFGIHKGDLLIVRRQRLAENGELITVMLNADFLVRRLKFHEGKISLVSGGGAAESVFIEAQDDFQITGLIWRISEAVSANDAPSPHPNENPFS